jgi:chemotaxis protein histidine kinase CheA
MSKSKPEKPTVVTYADHELITPPNNLLDALTTVRVSTPVDDPVKRAEEALEQISSEFAVWMDEECARLDRARIELKTKGFNRATREALFGAAHDIKGEAATFGFPWVAALAESLCRLIEHTPEMTRIPLTLVDQHVDGIRAIIRESARTDVGTVADELSKRLRDVTEEFLTYENRHRPEYLAAIRSPSIAPSE